VKFPGKVKVYFLKIRSLTLSRRGVTTGDAFAIPGQNKAHVLGMKDSFYDALIEGLKGRYQLGGLRSDKKTVPYQDWLKSVSPTFNWT
jgi:hypothetical protein